MTGVGHVVVKIIQVKAHLSGCGFMEAFVDLHDTSVSRVNFSLKDRTVSQLVAEGRFTASNFDHYRNIAEAFTDSELGITYGCRSDLALLVYLCSDLSVGYLRINAGSNSGNSKNS